MTFPKIELHVHLEGTVRASTLLQVARRNDVTLPADTVEELARLYQFSDFAHFLRVWALTTGALRTKQDFQQVVVDYAAEAARHGAVYLEGNGGAGHLADDVPGKRPTAREGSSRAVLRSAQRNNLPLSPHIQAGQGRTDDHSLHGQSPH